MTFSKAKEVAKGFQHYADLGEVGWFRLDDFHPFGSWVEVYRNKKHPQGYIKVHARADGKPIPITSLMSGSLIDITQKQFTELLTRLGYERKEE